MAKRILITGGAGFIGSHLADELLAHGYLVRALDSLIPQVHGESASRPEYLDAAVELAIGDVCDQQAVHEALNGVDAIVHLAARVGVGQSMYESADYTLTNNYGTAVLMDALMEHPVERLVVASSMSIYGEGLYRHPSGATVEGFERSLRQLKARDWEVRDRLGEKLSPLPTPESKCPSVASVYALSKFDQERMCLLMGGAYHISTVALRLFNVFGTRQALSNPYTGVLAIFAARLLNGNRPLIFEDGLQRRDFVNVKDVARAFRRALEAENVSGLTINIGSGQAFTIREIATRVARAMNRQELEPEITNACRIGDIRHCFADISLARSALGYAPEVSLDRGLAELTDWLAGQSVEDHVSEAHAELSLRGLTV